MSFPLEPQGGNADLVAGSSDHWRNQISKLPPDWRLIPCNANKRPIDHLTGQLLPEWGSRAVSPQELLSIEGDFFEAVGVVLGPPSGGLLAVDFDNDGYEEQFLSTYGKSIDELPVTIGWTSGKPGRKQLGFKVPKRVWPELRRRKTWMNKDKKTCLELRWARHQSIVLGAHPETNGYSWVPGCSPSDREVAEAPDWLLEPLRIKTRNAPSVDPALVTSDDYDRSKRLLSLIKPREDYDSWLKVGMALNSVDASLLDDYIEWSRGCANFDQKECTEKWSSFKGDGVGIGTLYYMANDDGASEADLRWAMVSSQQFDRNSNAGLPRHGSSQIGELDQPIHPQSHAEELSIQESLDELTRLYSQGQIDAKELIPPRLREALSVVRETISYDWSVLLLVLCVGISGALPLDSGIELIPGDFEQCLNLFAVLLMDTGELKSPLIKRLISTPWKKSVDGVMKARYLEALRQWKSMKDSSGDSDSYLDLPPRPVQAATLIHEDLTPQGVERHLVLHDQYAKGSILLLIDEAKDMLSEMAGQTVSPGYLRLGSWILSRYDGSGARGAKADAAFERHYSQCRLSALLCCQPDIYREIAGDSDQTGLAGRFVAVEQVTVDQNFPDQFDDEHLMRHKKLSRLLEELYLFVCDRDSIRLTLSDEARRLFQGERRLLNDRKNRTLNDAERGHLNKSHGRIGRLAGISHLLWAFQSAAEGANEIPEVVDVSAMEMGIILNRFLLSQSVLVRETSDGNNLSMKKILSFHARARKVVEPVPISSIRKALASSMRATPAETELIARSLHRIGVGRVTADEKGRLFYQALKRLGA